MQSNINWNRRYPTIRRLDGVAAEHRIYNGQFQPLEHHCATRNEGYVVGKQASEDSQVGIAPEKVYRSSRFGPQILETACVHQNMMRYLGRQHSVSFQIVWKAISASTRFSNHDLDIYRTERYCAPEGQNQSLFHIEASHCQNYFRNQYPVSSP